MTRKKPLRRDFLRLTSLATAAFLTSSPPALTTPSQSSRPDLCFASAHEALQAIRQKRISAVELLEQVLSQIEEHDSKIHAFVTLDLEEARRQARRCDETMNRNQELGPLHGLPIVIKDTFQTAGLRTTAGSVLFSEYIPDRDATVVARLKNAGAVVVGKTNVPEFASDMQSYNEVAETTNNPWNLSRTPGGSTGGGAAALASGMGFLELGSDIGGSIRVPAHFCGVYGHKPTVGLVPCSGHIPPMPGTVVLPSYLNVCGPLARSAEDLLLALKVTAGPEEPASLALQLSLPSGRKDRLRDFRLGFLLDDSYCPVTPEVKSILETTVDRLRSSGLELVEGWPEGVTFREMFETYLPLLAASFSEAQSPEEMELLRNSLDKDWGDYARLWLQGSELSFSDWLRLSSLRLEYRQKWQNYFQSFDAFLMPVAFVPAFRHDQKLSFFERKLQTSTGVRQYGDLLRWICAPTLTGCPATVAPVGRTAEGLPVGIQIMGPFMEDPTTIDLAARLADLIGGFEAPPNLA